MQSDIKEPPPGRRNVLFFDRKSTRRRRDALNKTILFDKA
jgi:hypothetical protein